MKILPIILILASSAHAEITIESRNGMTGLHSEGRPIARYLSENDLTFSFDKVDVTLTGQIYGTQNWLKRVSQEDGWTKVDAIRFQYGGEIKYHLSEDFSIYARHIMPIDRHDNTVGDG